MTTRFSRWCLRMVLRSSGALVALVWSLTAWALPIGTQYFAGGRANVSVSAPGYFLYDLQDTGTPDGATAAGSASLSLAESAGLLAGTAQFESDLSTGTLRGLAGVTEYPQSNAYFGSAVATASFGDSFTHLDGDEAFLFSDGSVSTFVFDIDGITQRSDPSNPAFYSQAFLRLYILEAGSLGQVVNDWGGIYCCGAPDLVENVIASTTVGLTPQSDFAENLLDPNDATSFVPVSVINGGLFEYSFNPGGDFDWWVELSVLSFINNASDRAPSGNSVVTDYFNTVTASYLAPAGSTVRSASGVFPVQSVHSVPEPGTVGLLAAGLLVFAFSQRRRRSHSLQPDLLAGNQGRC